MAQVTPVTQLQRTNWTVAQWCREANLSRVWFYRIPEDERPQMVTVGRSKFVIESPERYFQRLFIQQRGA